VAPSNEHLILERGAARPFHGPKENGFRPAIDALFRSAAESFGSRVVGVVLTGSNDDGSFGLELIKQAGGVTIVQDPDEAMFDLMPRSAIAAVEVDHVLPLDQIAEVVITLSGHEFDPAPAPGDSESTPELRGGSNGAAPSTFTCPECNGLLWEHLEGNAKVFVCRVGHTFSPERLLHLQSDNLEAILWSAVRAFEERAELSDRLAERMREHGHELSAQRFEHRVDDSIRQAGLLRDLLVRDTENEGIAQAP